MKRTATVFLMVALAFGLFFVASCASEAPQTAGEDEVQAPPTNNSVPAGTGHAGRGDIDERGAY